MKKLLAILPAAALAIGMSLPLTANAFGWTPPGPPTPPTCQGNCPTEGGGVGDITNTANGGDAKAYGGDANVGNGFGNFSPKAEGGEGGAGGDGGNAKAKVKNSGNSSSKSGVKNSGNSSSKSKSGVKNSGNSSSKSKSKSNAQQAQGQAQGLKSNIDASDNSVSTSTYNEAARTAYSAALTASAGTCMGSSSGGVQGMDFGVTVGTTWKDSSCDRRRDVATLIALQSGDAARALMCQKDSVRKAYSLTDTPCPQDTKGAEIATLNEQLLATQTAAINDAPADRPVTEFVPSQPDN